MLAPVSPLLEDAVATFATRARGIGRASVLPELDVLVELLRQALESVAVPLVARVIALEVNVSRERGELRGADPRERFMEFCDSLRPPQQALSLLAEYPVLVRLVAIAVRQRAEFFLEVLQHLRLDRDLLGEVAGVPKLGSLVNVTWDLGDRHRGGRNVLSLSFSCGGSLIYKPKSLGVDLTFQRLLVWFNGAGFAPEFRTLQMLDRETYGWQERVQAEACTSADDVARFFQRQGGNLALLYLLGATDGHLQNVIASGEHPIIVDLETLLHPSSSVADGDATDPAETALLDSVLRTGLLPHPSFRTPYGRGVNMSGFGGGDPKQLPFPVPVWRAVGTDQVRVSEENSAAPEASNRPLLAGKRQDAIDYRDALMEGFAKAYQLVQRKRGSFLEEGGPLSWFEGRETRVVLRPTMVYSQLRQAMHHPDALREGLDQEVLLAWLGNRLEVGATVAPSAGARAR